VFVLKYLEVFGAGPLPRGGILKLHQADFFSASPRLRMEMALAPDDRLDEGRLHPVTLRCNADRAVLAPLESTLPPPVGSQPSQQEEDYTRPTPVHAVLLAHFERCVERYANALLDFPLPAPDPR
jgi:hypothetical protein